MWTIYLEISNFIIEISSISFVGRKNMFAKLCIALGGLGVSVPQRSVKRSAKLSKCSLKILTIR